MSIAKNTQGNWFFKPFYVILNVLRKKIHQSSQALTDVLTKSLKNLSALAGARPELLINEKM